MISDKSSHENRMINPPGRIGKWHIFNITLYKFDVLETGFLKIFIGFLDHFLCEIQTGHLDCITGLGMGHETAVLFLLCKICKMLL